MPDDQHAAQQRFSRAAPISFNAAQRTLEVVFSTGAAVSRRDWWTGTPFTEVLEISETAIDLSRLKAGAPVLNTHAAYDLSGMVGVVEAARVERGQAIATIRLSARPDVAGVVQDVADGVIRNVSAAYTVQEWRIETPSDGAPEIRTAVRWTPYEISLVPIPADPGAQARAYSPTHERFTTMPGHEDSAVTAERSRAADIMTIADQAGMDVAWVRNHITNGTSLDAVRSEALASVASRGTPRVPPAARIAEDDIPSMRVIEDALFSRMSGREPTPEARQFRGLSLIELARATLEMRGERATRWASPADILSRSFSGGHGTGDFPNLLGIAANRALLDRYQRAQSPLRAVLARPRDVPDFRNATLLRLSEAPQLKEVPEHGEVTHGTAGESSEGYRVRTFARIFGLTRQAIINDDLGAFTDFTVNMASAAAETEAQEILALLTANAGLGANLSDGNALFDASRSNTGTGALDVTAVGAGRAVMRKTKGMDAVTPIAAEPRYLLVAPDQETAADTVVTTITPAVATNVNPFAGNLTKLCEPRLTGPAWYLFADPNAAPVIEAAYLEGSSRGPIIAMKEGWDVLGIEFRAVLDFGCGLIGWRGAFRSTGS